MVGIEAYMSIRKHVVDGSLSFFSVENEEAIKDKVHISIIIYCNFLQASILPNNRPYFACI